MPSEYSPRIGDWYETATGHSFEVIAYDEEEETVEIQYFDGTLEELDLESWYDLEIDPVEPPEDWSGSMDVDREDVDRDGKPSNGPLDWSILDDLDQ